MVRPVTVCGSELSGTVKQEEQRLHTTEMKMLRWCQGKTRKDRIKNETISVIANVTPIKSVLSQKRLSWYQVWECDAEGGDPPNKKHNKYEGDGNNTQRMSKDAMD